MDKLEQMMALQKGFQDKLGNNVLSQPFLNEQTLALVIEAGEALQETNWKTWKKPKKVDIGKHQEEVVDMFHFMLNIVLASGMSAEDLFDRFMEKHLVNRARQDGGY